MRFFCFISSLIAFQSFAMERQNILTCDSNNERINYYIKAAKKKTDGMDINNESDISFCLSPGGADNDKVCIVPNKRINENNFKPFPPRETLYWTWKSPRGQRCYQNGRIGQGLGVNRFVNRIVYTIYSESYPL